MRASPSSPKAPAGRPIPLLPLLPLLLLLSLGACASSGVANGGPSPEVMYQAAVRDAAVADPWEVSRQLRAIVPQEPGVRWQGDPGASPVLVVLWATAEVAEALPVASTAPAPEELWVTLAPDLEQFCRGLRPAVREQRLRQILGLPPGAERSQVLELWVDREALFRPCPDPEVTDHECELNFPRPEARVAVGTAHREWFEALKERVYTPEEGPGRPWTRLGYTYHWGHRAAEEGLSEFVVPAGAPVTVHRALPPAEYCRS